MAKVLITGASGFIGSNLVSHAKFYPDFKLIPVSRKKLPNYFFVENYKSSPKSDILIYLSEDSNRNIVSKDSEHYLNYNKNTLSELLQKNYSKFMNKILTHPGIDEFKKNTQKKIKKFSSINLLKLVDKYVSDRLNKIYIKNKFTEIIKKYNI